MSSIRVYDEDNAMIKEKIEAMSFSNVREIKVSDITFEPELIDLCKQNHCGNYGKCYTCPPLVGETASLIEKAKTFDNAIIFQKIYPLEDSFDIEGMGEASRDFKELVQTVNDMCSADRENMLVLSAGGCKLCERCGAIDGIPCRFPEKALASLESYGMNVSKLAAACGINYINGQNTVTYFGGVLYR